MKTAFSMRKRTLRMNRITPMAHKEGQAVERVKLEDVRVKRREVSVNSRKARQLLNGVKRWKTR